MITSIDLKTKMGYLKSTKYMSAIILLFYVSGDVNTECIHEKSQWFMQLGLRESPNSLKYIQRGKPTNVEMVPSQRINEIQPVYDHISKEIINEDVQKSPLPLVSLANSYYYFGSYFKTNYYQAMQFCEDHGMNLLSIESYIENDEIIKHLKKNYLKIEHVWTSGTDLGLEGEFVWLSTGKHFNFTNWSPPQPDNAGKIENCLEILKQKDGHYIWNDKVCSDSLNFICELKECSNFCANTL